MSTTDTTERVRAAVYCRLTLAVMGDTTKVEDQERICRDLAAMNGWEVAGVFSDNSRSAWSKRRKRPEWDRMLGQIDQGQINGIIVYHGDRLVRQPFDLETLLNLAESKGIRLASPTGQRNLDSPDDRFVLRILVAQACMESDNTSRRRKSQYERWRREGKVRAGGRGGRAFGFATDGVTHVPGECAIVREAATRVLGGEGIGAICRDLGERGIITTTGIPFQHGTLRKLLARPRYAGLMPDGIREAAWQPVLDRATWELVRIVLDGRASGFGHATNARRHLLSGIAICGAPGCGAPLQIRRSQGKGNGRHLTGYGCTRPGCRKVYRDRTLLDAYVGRRVVNRLNDPRNPEPRAPDVPGLAAEFAALTRSLRETDEALADHTRGAVPALMARREGIERRLGELRELAAGDAAVRLRTRYQGISWEEFLALPLHVRRSLVGACFRVTVLPVSKRGPGFRSEDVQLSPL